MSVVASVNSSKNLLDAGSSVRSTDSDINMCKHCKSRHAIIKKLKKLFAELELNSMLESDDEPLDEEEVIPLITYPITPQFDDSYRRKKEKHAQRYPPWKLPRFPSQELIGGKLCNTCECRKRNGLQDYCQRTMCRGSLQCLQKPDPLCIPSGMWKKCVQPQEAKQILRWLNKIEEIGVDEGDQGVAYHQQVPCCKCGHTVCKCRNKKTKTTNNKQCIKKEKKIAKPASVDAKKRCSKDIKWDVAEKQCNDYVPPKESPNSVKRTVGQKKEQPINSHRGKR
ncbi:uncharacterized protein LOC106671033 [Cimex lectularius]|uniref:Uncharacterized protein n=1 Tax=Cimex lectularius TaxID=79782 RepID=A0A8I6S5L4_CIMLE|nr:uncharacterized protein LOC106671033 [Cimex lectularius]